MALLFLKLDPLRFAVACLRSFLWVCRAILTLIPLAAISKKTLKVARLKIIALFRLIVNHLLKKGLHSQSEHYIIRALRTNRV